MTLITILHIVDDKDDLALCNIHMGINPVSEFYKWNMFVKNILNTTDVPTALFNKHREIIVITKKNESAINLRDLKKSLVEQDVTLRFSKCPSVQVIKSIIEACP